MISNILCENLLLKWSQLKTRNIYSFRILEVNRRNREFQELEAARPNLNLENSAPFCYTIGLIHYQTESAQKEKRIFSTGLFHNYTYGHQPTYI